MLASGRHLYVFFCCQQAVEKMLKALVVTRLNEFPPRIHNLVRLAEAAGVQVTEERTAWLRRLAGYYILTRYPEERGDVPEVTDRESREILRETKDVIAWLRSMM